MKKIFNKLGYLIFGLFIISFVFGFVYTCITSSFEVWKKDFALIEFGNYGSGTILLIINNLLFNIFGKFANEIASILLFILGISAFGTFSVAGYSIFSSLRLKKRKKLYK
tara:strand:- start:150 stop:479 length:330 start_codon:yes stop_codon:yes gene_type:complete